MLREAGLYIGPLGRGRFREGPTFGEAVPGQATSEEVGLGRGVFWGYRLRGGGLRGRWGGFGGEPPHRRRAQGEAESGGEASEEAGSGRGRV